MTKYIDRYYLNGELYGIKFDEWWGGWQPGANTVAYYPLNWDILDHSGHGYNGVAVTESYETLSSWKEVYTFNINKNNVLWLTNLPTATVFDWNQLTVSFWIYYIHSNNERIMCFWPRDSSFEVTWSIIKFTFYDGSVHWPSIAISSVETSTWHHLVWVRDKAEWVKLYLDGVLSATNNFVWNASVRNNVNSSVWWQYIWWQLFSNSSMNWKMSEIIFEDKARTAQEIEDYFNQTKSLYGIS